ncbi:MAG TPA: hypothetical protein VES42_21595 [Pilimelia sp.]|nr:hypothetical protein [Pilimelia sp.]
MSRTPPNGAGLFRRLAAGTVGAAAATALVLGGTAVPAAAAPVALTEFSYTYGETTGTFTAPAADIGLSGTNRSIYAGINTDDEWWSVALEAPRGEVLRPGVFRDAERAGFQKGRAPGLSVSGNGSGCNEVYGQFTIDQIETDATGAVTVLDARFSRRCESATATPMTGRLRYRAYPLSYRFVSDAGDYIGQGQTKSYANSNSILTLSGTTAGIGYGVAGRRDSWSVSLRPKRGETLAVGRYTGAQRFADADHPGLDVTANSRGCNATTGSFVIRELVVDDAGAVIALFATFEQHCEGGEPALRGTIRHFA